MISCPEISFFISFYQLDPSIQKQCIFFTQKGARCRSACRDQDNKRAVELQNLLKAMRAEDINIRMLSEYAQCNCCLWKRAQHRDKIEDLQILRPLAERWLNEIRARQDKSLNKAKPVMHRLIRDRTSTAAVSAETGKLYMSKGSGNSSHTFNGLDISKGYDLRIRPTNRCENLVQSQVTQPALPEFRRHIVEPSPGDSVHQMILSPLKKRDFETGSLYIFDRESSPGHVKIGWTAKTVSSRLADWSKCGYKPNLLFSMNGIPHARRVETLTHYELIKEWRRERMCKGPRCGKSHKEWFEISKELAERTVRDWAEFLLSAKPYHVQGHLKDQWKDVINGMYRETKEVTAQKLLSIREVVINKTISTEKFVADLPVPKTEKDIKEPLLPPKESEGEDGCGDVVKVEQTGQSESNGLRRTSVKNFEVDLLGKPGLAQEFKTIHVQVKNTR